MKQMEQFGKEYAEALDTHLENHSQLDGVRAALLKEKRTPWQNAGPLVWKTAFAVAAVTAVIMIALLWPDSAMTYTIGEQKLAGAEGEFLHATALLPLQFSDGTQIVFRPGTKGRVENLGPKQVRMRLDKGNATFRVIHHDNVGWQIDGGPFRVYVVGTQFEITWEPSQHAFTLSLQKGEVRVEGPGLKNQRVREGQTLRAHSETEQVSLYSTTSGPQSDALQKKPIEQINTEPVSPKSPVAKTYSRSSQRQKAPDWKELAQEARFTESMTEARKLGWEDLLRNLPAEDLVLLAGTARLAGARDDSLTGFERVQKRFPGTQMADNALFQIARMVQSSGETARALQYYNTYLNNQPAGPYAMEASGRRLEVLQKMKRSEEAKAAAKAYLQTYPSGSHANVAQQILRADAP